MTATPTTTWQWDEGILPGVTLKRVGARTVMREDDTPFVFAPPVQRLVPYPDDVAIRRRTPPQPSAGTNPGYDEINPLAYGKGEFLPFISSQWYEVELPGKTKPQLVKAVDEEQRPLFKPAGMFLPINSGQWNYDTAAQNPRVRPTPTVKAEAEERIDAPFMPGEFIPGLTGRWIQSEQGDQNPRLRATPRTREEDEARIIPAPMPGEFAIGFLKTSPGSWLQLEQLQVRTKQLRIRLQDERVDPPLGKGEFPQQTLLQWVPHEPGTLRRRINSRMDDLIIQPTRAVGEFLPFFIGYAQELDVPIRRHMTPLIETEDDQQAPVSVPPGMFIAPHDQWDAPEPGPQRARRPKVLDEPLVDVALIPPPRAILIPDADWAWPRKRRAMDQAQPAEAPVRPLYPTWVEGPDLIIPRRYRLREVPPADMDLGQALPVPTPKVMAELVNDALLARRAGKGFASILDQGDVFAPLRQVFSTFDLDLPAVVRKRRTVEQQPATDVTPPRALIFAVADLERPTVRKTRSVEQPVYADIFPVKVPVGYEHDPDSGLILPRRRGKAILDEGGWPFGKAFQIPPPPPPPSFVPPSDFEQPQRVQRRIARADWAQSITLPEPATLPPLIVRSGQLTYARRGNILRQVSLYSRQRVPAITDYVAGDSLRITFTLRDEQNLPVPLAGVSFIWTLTPIVLDHLAAAPILSHTLSDNRVVVVDPVNSVVSVLVASHELTMLGDFLQELKITLPTGDTYTAVRGIVTVNG